MTPAVQNCARALCLCALWLSGLSACLSAGEAQPDTAPKKTSLFEPGAGPEALPPLPPPAATQEHGVGKIPGLFVSSAPAPQASSAEFSARSVTALPSVRVPDSPPPAPVAPAAPIIPFIPVALSSALLASLDSAPPADAPIRAAAPERVERFAKAVFPELHAPALTLNVERKAVAPAVDKTAQPAEPFAPVALTTALLQALVSTAVDLPLAPSAAPNFTSLERGEARAFPPLQYRASRYAEVAPPAAPPEPWISIPLSAYIQKGLLADAANLPASTRRVESAPGTFAALTPQSLPVMRIPDLKAFSVLPLEKKTPSASGKLPEPGDLGAGDLSESVTLPATVREQPPQPPSAPPRIEEKVTLSLKLEKPVLAPGEAAMLLLGGPDAFLNDAIAEYSLSDELGRRILHEAIALRGVKADESSAPEAAKIRRIKLDPPLELAMQRVRGRTSAPYHLHLDMTLHGGDKRQARAGIELTIVGAAVPPADNAAAPEWDGWISFAANPPAKIEWEKLNKLGITGGLQYRLNAARRDALRAGDAPFFVENVSRQMLSRYHTERGLWDKTLAAISANPGSTAPLYREPSLCSSAFADTFAAETGKVAEAFANDRPLFFSLASEPSMTRLNLPADFDFSPAALEEFRRWLERDIYGTLPALNEEWGTRFENWQAVLPMTTPEARARLKDGVGNFAPWADFREFQDYTFSKVLREGGEQIRATIPGAKTGITGALGPFAYGGWDWSRLADALDVVESYDIGGARALWRDLAPGKPALASISIAALAGEKNPAERAELEHALWRFALEGGPRGALVWEAPGTEGALLNDNGEPTDAAKSATPVLRQLSGETGKILAHARREHDGVALLYSPASIRLYWLLEADRVPGGDWLQHWGGDSSAERSESLQLRLRESWGKLLDDLGLGWRFISSRELEKGLLERKSEGIKTVLLPRTIALSDREVEALKTFAAHGGQVIADSACGRFDEHGKVRTRAALDELFGVNTTTEPAFARRMKTLERVGALPGNDGPSARWDTGFLNNLPPVFSDEPKWSASERSGLRKGAEYRMSPVLALGANTCFLNLDLTDYLRWRLVPASKRAAAARRALLDAGLKKRLDESFIDWEKSSLPAGTQLSRLSLGTAPGAGFILALRRNPQSRLNELGADGEANSAFEKPETFKLVLREKIWLSRALPAEHSTEPAEVTVLEGTLDPVTPKIFMLGHHPPEALALKVSTAVEKLAAVTLSVQAPVEPVGGALYKIRVSGPDDRERAHYGALISSRDGALSHTFIPALNDPSGKWTVSVEDLLSGASAVREITVKDEE